MPATYRPLTLADGLRAAAARAPDKVALYAEDEALRFDTLIERINRIANAATHALGLGTGDHVTLLAPNCIEYVELVVGLAAAGCATVTANPHLGETEFRAIYADSDTKALFVLRGLAAFYKDESNLADLIVDWVNQRGFENLDATAFRSNYSLPQVTKRLEQTLAGLLASTLGMPHSHPTALDRN